ncbi:hypothetical protein GCM10008922_41280 [Faecalicatena contorta]|nr:hypothetical protein CE91St64_19600 [Faecalicatena contorta]
MEIGQGRSMEGSFIGRPVPFHGKRPSFIQTAVQMPVSITLQARMPYSAVHGSLNRNNMASQCD